MKAWIGKEQKNKVVVVSAVRTPYAKAMTKMKDCAAVQMGVVAATEAIARANINKNQIEEVCFGNIGTPIDAPNISRVIGLRVGINESVPAYTVHRNCASAMEAIAQACLKIGSGMCDTMLVGGTESMSNMPLLYGDEMKELFSNLMNAKTAQAKIRTILSFRPHYLKPVVSILEGLTDPICGLNMGQTAEVLALDFGISRLSQDEFALRSHQKVIAAKKEGKFKDEIVPIVLPPTYSEYLDEDIGPRENQTLEALQKLKPFFDKENGTVTAGNSCQITDGAVALILMNEEKAKAEGYKVLSKIHSWAFAACEPKRMGLGPTFAISKLLQEVDLELSNFDLIELNEAFAAQVIANECALNSKKFCEEKLGRTSPVGELREDRLNVNGGAIALGHPVSTSGGRLIMTLSYEMKRRNINLGLATLCVGGGQGAAFIIENS